MVGAWRWVRDTAWSYRCWLRAAVAVWAWAAAGRKTCSAGGTVSEPMAERPWKFRLGCCRYRGRQLSAALDIGRTINAIVRAAIDARATVQRGDSELWDSHGLDAEPCLPLHDVE